MATNANMVPELKTMVLLFNAGMYPVEQIGSDIITLSGLQRLEIKNQLAGAPGGNFLALLSTLPHLESLDLALAHTYQSPQSSSFPPNPFPLLTNVGISGTVNTISAAIVTFYTAPIIAMRITLNDAVVQNDQKFQDLLSNICRLPTSFHSLSIHFATLSTITTGMVQPLLQLASLTVVQVNGQGRWDIEDGDIDVISQSWPLLAELHIAGPGTAKLSLQGLLDLAVKLPHLRDLTVPVNPTTIPQTHFLSDTVYPKIASLSLMPDTRLVDPFHLARFLSFAFPNAELTIWSQAVKWDQVCQLVPIFQAVRREDRLRFEHEKTGLAPKAV